MTKKVSLYTLGCKLNFAETSSLAKAFEERGYERTNKMTESDVVIVNTCSVTALSEKKGRNIISRARKANPNATIVAMGCYAQLAPEKLAAMDKIDLVLGNHEKYNVFDYLENPSSQITYRKPYKEILNFNPAWSSNDRTRTFLKVQDGCDYFCAYCTIPMARGLSRSPKIETIIPSVKEIVASGSQEIILTGVNIGDFGRHQGESFIELLKNIAQVDGLHRLRISSIEPNLLTDEVIELAAQTDCIMPHFHIPLQCGTDEMLQKMNRRYTTDVFRGRVEKIKTLMPDAFIAADVIVGVPGETEAHHKQAMQFIESMELSALHVFTYSKRPGTKAAQMPNHVEANEQHQRSVEMHELSNRLQLKFIENQLNTTRSVLFEKEQKDEYIYGFTDNYLRIKAKLNTARSNNIVNAKLLRANDDLTIECEIL